MAAVAAQKNRVVIGWQGITLWVPEDWYPAALGTERASGYLRVQSAEGPTVEIKWFSPRGAVDLEKELAKYRRTLERAARKRRLQITWKAKPKVPVREAKPDKNRRFFGWRSDAEALGAIWYCRTCGRVVIAQATTPLAQEGSALAAGILSSIEDHGDEGEDLWALFGLQARVPQAWALERHQLLAGYTMLQFRHRDRMLRVERWGLANVALRGTTLQTYLWEKSRKLWRDFRLVVGEEEWQGHPGVHLSGRTRRLWTRLVVGPVRALLRRPAADRLSVRAWHCPAGNKVFAVHAVHPRGDTSVLESAAASVVCHE